MLCCAVAAGGAASGQCPRMVVNPSYCNALIIIITSPPCLTLNPASCRPPYQNHG